MNLLSERRVLAWRLGYLFACLGAIALLPTNFFLAFSLAVAVSCYLASSPMKLARQKREACVLLLGMPVFCLLLAYAGVWDELLSFSGVDFSDWTRSGLIREWLRGSISNFVWVSPLIGAGVAVGLTQLARDGI